MYYRILLQSTMTVIGVIGYCLCFLLLSCNILKHPSNCVLLYLVI